MTIGEQNKRKNNNEISMSVQRLFFFLFRHSRHDLRTWNPKNLRRTKKISSVLTMKGLFYFLTFTESKTAHYRHRVKEKIKVNVFLLLIRREHNPHLMLLFFPQKWLVTKKSGFVVLSSEDFPHCTRLLFIVHCDSFLLNAQIPALLFFGVWFFFSLAFSNKRERYLLWKKEHERTRRHFL